MYEFKKVSFAREERRRHIAWEWRHHPCERYYDNEYKSKAVRVCNYVVITIYSLSFTHSSYTKISFFFFILPSLILATYCIVEWAHYLHLTNLSNMNIPLLAETTPLLTTSMALRFPTLTDGNECNLLN